MSVPIGNTFPVSGTVSSNSTNDTIVFNSSNTTCNGGLTLASTNGVATTIRADGNGNLVWRGSMDGTNSVYKSVTFSKSGLEEKLKEFQAGKYTRKYIETYLDFMVMNAMLDNLEYLEYKASLDKGL